MENSEHQKEKMIGARRKRKEMISGMKDSKSTNADQYCKETGNVLLCAYLDNSKLSLQTFIGVRLLLDVYRRNFRQYEKNCSHCVRQYNSLLVKHSKFVAKIADEKQGEAINFFFG